MGARHSKPVQHDSTILPPIDESREVHHPYVAINPWHAYVRCRFRRQTPRCRTISDKALLRIIESDALLREAHTGVNIPAIVNAFLVDPDNVARTLGMLTSSGPWAAASAAADSGAVDGGAAATLHPKARDTAKAMLTKALTRRRHRARSSGGSATASNIHRSSSSSSSSTKGAATAKPNGGTVNRNGSVVNGGASHVNRGGKGAPNGPAPVNRGSGVVDAGTTTTPRASNGAATEALNGVANGHAASNGGAVVKGTPGRRTPPPPSIPNPPRKGLSWWSRIMVAVTVVAVFQSRPRFGRGRHR